MIRDPWSKSDCRFRTYIAPAVHISELVQMCFDSGQVVLLYEGKQTLDGQRRHLEGGGGVHDRTLARCAPLEGGRRSGSDSAEQFLNTAAMSF